MIGHSRTAFLRCHVDGMISGSPQTCESANPCTQRAMRSAYPASLLRRTAFTGLPTVAHVLSGKRERRLVTLTFASWNQIIPWLRRIDGLRSVA